MLHKRWSTITGKDVDGVTSEQCIVNAGLDWTVKQAGVQATINGQLVQVPNVKLNYREDTGDILGTVTDRYEVLQNKVGFKLLDSVVGSMEAMYVNAGLFGGGKRVYIQAKLPGYIQFGDGEDRAEKFLTFITSHDGSTPVVMNYTPTRIVCQNTFLMAMTSEDCKSSIKHTLTMHERLLDAQAILNVVNAKTSMLESLSKKLIDTPFAENKFERVLETIGMIGKETEKSTRSLNILDEVTNLFKQGAGAELATAKGTAWGAYNAVVEYVDHYRGSNQVKRAESAIIGSGAAFKHKALELLAA